MKSGNEKKAALLGMPLGTAANRLRKMILFWLLERHHENVCFRCCGPIQSVDDLSIEHKMPWLSSENPKASFFAPDNVAFSHLKCNTAAASKPNKRYGSDRERWREASRRRYADPKRYEQHLNRKRRPGEEIR